jgi:hypothetical protein
MAEIVKQLAGDGVPGNEDFPPMYYIKFDREEFGKFLSDPSGTMKELGYEVERLNVAISNSAWVSGQRQWIKASDISSHDLPTASSWTWWCGYSDEMCVCYQVLGG